MLHEKAMLVNLAISQWTARKLDKKASAEVAQAHGNNGDWGRYNKSLIAKTALEEIAKIATEARTYHYANTLPWSDNGQRILPSARYMQYTTDMRAFCSRFDNAADQLEINYDSLVSQAQANLNGLFNPADYPPAHKARKSFAFSFDIDPLPTSADFRVNIGDAEAEIIRQQIEQRSADRVRTAMRDAAGRLLDAVQHAAAKLADKDAIFRDSMIGNIRDLCSILPALNITDDPTLAQAITDTTATLAKYEPQTLRDNPTIREKTASAAQAITAKLSDYVGVL